MRSFLDPIINAIDSLLAWFSISSKQVTSSYCDLETADDEHTLVSRDGSLISIFRIDGVTHLVGREEFDRIHAGLCNALQTGMKRAGHAFQFYFSYDRKQVYNDIKEVLRPARETTKRVELNLDDLLNEREEYISSYCAQEKMFLVLWTRPTFLSAEQNKRAHKEKLKFLRKRKVPNLKSSQNFFAAIPDLRNEHDSFVRAMKNDLEALNLTSELLEVHDALHEVRMSVDPEFTSQDWRPVLPGDKIPVRDLKETAGKVADVVWPNLGKQLFPRDAENVDLRTCRIGDKIYSSVFIDLFPQEVKSFISLFSRTLPTRIPWRISYFVESNGLASIRFKSLIASIVSFASPGNRLLHDASKALQQVEVGSDDAVVRLRVALSTWAPEDDMSLLRVRTSELAKAVEGWGSCEVSELSGDPVEGIVSSMLAMTGNNVATASVAPLSEVVLMLPFARPASPWRQGAVLLRSPDGKPWPYQPGSSKQTTWIDLMYARPGSGKSVLSNAINLGLCMAAGIQRLPRIAIIDIGPSSSGLISLIREALPAKDRHLAAYHRLQMTPDYSINPFDTQLGSRFPTAQERAFLVNFLTLLTTPLGSQRPYDGMGDMVGLVVDELYKHFSDENSPRVYTPGIELVIDGVLEEIDFVRDQHTTWWEVTDALFVAGFSHEAQLAQRYAMPLLADTASIARSQSIEDLYGKVQAPTGESLIVAFSRMISGAVREYPILSKPTKFDLGDARIVSLDLDEVAKSGGDAADRQTAVMYMLARYVMAKHYYLTESSLAQLPEKYRDYHAKRIAEIREDPKRLVYDEFHRTSKSQAVRDQVILDMREGRKWNVQIALLSQSLDDFDEVMVEFATSIFIMDAGPEQAIKRSTEVFGLSDTAQHALRTRVHGPREGGAVFLAQFATKRGKNLQLLSNTLGPIELWAFSTTSEDALLRNKLYKQLGAKEARRLLARLFPNGTVRPVIELRLATMKEEKGAIEEEDKRSIVDKLVSEILEAYAKDPDVKRLAE
ncbi:MAG: type IV secretion protein IcmB [Legionellaceae bacterium]|nr:type IV secretion protein IcmB [Legionellaceae bacterium]